MAVEFDVLGDLVVRVGGRVVDLGHARRQCVLAALLVDANRAVSLDQPADRVWGEAVPERAGTTLWSYLSRLRRLVGPVIARGPLGYRIVVEPGYLDLHRYRDAVAAGEHAEALALWRGAPFAGLHTEWLDRTRAGVAAARARRGRRPDPAEPDRSDRVVPQRGGRAAGAAAARQRQGQRAGPAVAAGQRLPRADHQPIPAARPVGSRGRPPPDGGPADARRSTRPARQRDRRRA
ncbi:hypothetical protein FHS29_005171 [Saccharothrix tamanrassetensis]|uniref:OmpR/PhoB-type domain-containing protein n=1 Tax=Saccharothrix tamanrassetensis TaxID=1051531 RepID=A0A841CNS2_9PSEU|nr:hypothetical protein [Saccharothrix tamanrassetensis]MBB5958563.1 hypothetical protein [Saccharothrix tamanrassetensis]